VLLQDYRDGLLGRISLETPATRSAMLAAEQARRLPAPADAALPDTLA
jgi:ribosome biogenesis GTPase A